MGSMLPRAAQAESADRARPTRVGGALRGASRWLERIGIPAATAILVSFAIAGAMLSHYIIGVARGASFGWGFAAEIAAVTILLATPFVVFAQLIIRRHAAARRSLKHVTERLAIAVDTAERANQSQTQFLANMSHELRTPLNAIIGFSDLIQTQKLGPVGHQRYLDYVKDISQSGHHLLRIINDILDLAKIQAGRSDIRDEEEFNLSAVIDATLRMMRPLAERQGVALEVAGDLRGLRLLAVERMVCQILLNLLSNAVKFTPANGRVALGATANAEGGLVIAVTDTGVGMTAEDITVALTPFGPVGKAMSRKHAGTGLGLPLAKAMMELHGGSLMIASVPGRGTTVSLTFPPARFIRPKGEAARVTAANAEPGEAARRGGANRAA